MRTTFASARAPNSLPLTLGCTGRAPAACAHLLHGAQQLAPQLLAAKLLGHVPVHLEAGGAQVHWVVLGLACEAVGTGLGEVQAATWVRLKSCL